MPEDGDPKEKDEEREHSREEEEALGRSYVADTPDEDPRLEATGVSTTENGREDRDGEENPGDGSEE